MKKYISIILFFLLLHSCTSMKKINRKDKFNYIVAYNYLLKNKYVYKSYRISNNLKGSKISFFNTNICHKPLKIKQINDSTPPKELLNLKKCLDSLDEIDRKSENISLQYPLKKILHNHTNYSDYLIYFSIPINNIITVTVCHIKDGIYSYDCGSSIAYYLKIKNDSVIEFYKQNIH